MKDPVLVTLFPTDPDFTDKEVVDWAKVYRARRRTQGDPYTELYFYGVERPVKVLESVEDMIFGVNEPEGPECKCKHEAHPEADDDLVLEEVEQEAEESKNATENRRQVSKKISKENS